MLGRLVQRYQAVARDVDRTAETRHQIVGKERAAEPIRLLRRLAGRARGQERVALHIGGLPGEERCSPATALAAGQGTGAAAIHYGNVNVSAQRLDASAQIRIDARLAAEQEAEIVRVSDIIEDNFCADVGVEPRIIASTASNQRSRSTGLGFSRRTVSSDRSPPISAMTRWNERASSSA